MARYRLGRGSKVGSVTRANIYTAGGPRGITGLVDRASATAGNTRFTSKANDREVHGSSLLKGALFIINRFAGSELGSGLEVDSWLGIGLEEVRRLARLPEPTFIQLVVHVALLDWWIGRLQLLAIRGSPPKPMIGVIMKLSFQASYKNTPWGLAIYRNVAPQF
nr:hypothetical protein [Tanacetum cinerariifolium]